MTSKDYTLIAKALFASQPASLTFASRSPEEEREVNAWHVVTVKIACALSDDNAAFNHDKFLQVATWGK